MYYLINELRENKNGLFDSDDNDDAQYSPDEREPEIKNIEQPTDVCALVKTVHVSLPVLAPVVETKSRDCSS